MVVPEPRKLSSGNYFIQLRLGGESVSVTAPTAKECRDKARSIKSQHVAGEKRIQRSKSNPTLTQAIDDYIAARSNTLSPSTIRGYRTIQRNRFETVMEKRLKDIKDWQTICNNEAKLCGAKTLKNSYCFIVSVLRENGIHPTKVTLPQVVKSNRPWLTPEQITVFVRAIKGNDCEIPALLALHSLRRSEVCAVTWEEHIDLKAKRILVSGALVPDEEENLVLKETNKNSASQRYVPIMIDELYKALIAVKDKTGLVVKEHPNTVWARINKVCEENGLPLVGNHGLRHSFASLAYHLGMPEMVAMRIGGWSDPATMRDIYTHLADADIKKHTDSMVKFYKNANKNANKDKKASIINAYSV